MAWERIRPVLRLLASIWTLLTFPGPTHSDSALIPLPLTSKQLGDLCPVVLYQSMFHESKNTDGARNSERCGRSELLLVQIYSRLFLCDIRSIDSVAQVCHSVSSVRTLSLFFGTASKNFHQDAAPRNRP